MYVRTATVTVALTVLAGCGGVSGGGAGGGSATTDQQTYQIAERIDALVVDARAAAVILETGDGPITVNEMRVSTQAGAMALRFTGAPSMVRASTQVGAVEVQVPSGTSYAVDVQTTLGRSDVSVQRDPASPHKIEIRTNVGAVKVGNG